MGMVINHAVDAVRREESQRRRAEESPLSDPVIQPDPAEDVVDEIGLPEERRAVPSFATSNVSGSRGRVDHGWADRELRE